jgi:hypothetical protein
MMLPAPRRDTFLMNRVVPIHQDPVVLLGEFTLFDLGMELLMGLIGSLGK